MPEDETVSFGAEITDADESFIPELDNSFTEEYVVMAQKKKVQVSILCLTEQQVWYLTMTPLSSGCEEFDDALIYINSKVKWDHNVAIWSDFMLRSSIRYSEHCNWFSDSSIIAAWTTIQTFEGIQRSCHLRIQVWFRYLLQS